MARRSTGEGSIGKRADGTYYGTIRLEGKRRWVYGETRKEVAGKLKALQQKHEEGVHLDADRTTVEEFLERWLKDVVKHRNKHKTYTTYEQTIRSHIKPILGKIALGALRPDHIQTLVNDLAKNKAPRTVRNVRAVLRQALNQAMRWRYVTFNAAALVETPRIEKFEIQPFSREEARRFMEHLKGHRLEALYLMALFLGLREGELLGLLITNLDLAAGTVKVDGMLQWQEGKLVRTTTKTKASVRILPLPASLLPALKEHLQRQQATFPKNPYVFASTAGTPLYPRNLVRQFKGLLEEAGLRAIRFHDLRHTTATFLIARGEHPRTVMDILGHSQISTTLNTYGHILDETRTDAITGLDGFLNE